MEIKARTAKTGNPLTGSIGKTMTNDPAPAAGKRAAAPAKTAASGKQREGRTVDSYIAGLDGWRAEVAAALRRIVREAAPGAEEAIKWGQPVYSQGGPVCYFKAFKNHVNLGFWRGLDLADPAGVLVSSGKKMAHVKLAGMEDVRPDLLGQFVRQAVALNKTLGDPTRG